MAAKEETPPPKEPSFIQLMPLESFKEQQDHPPSLIEEPKPVVGYSVKRSTMTNKWMLVQSKNHQKSRSEVVVVEKDMVEVLGIKQRQGFVPGHPKPNQDAFICVRDLAKIPGLWMFGVCDGHGLNGHMVSAFVKKALP